MASEQSSDAEMPSDSDIDASSTMANAEVSPKHKVVIPPGLKEWLRKCAAAQGSERPPWTVVESKATNKWMKSWKAKGHGAIADELAKVRTDKRQDLVLRLSLVKTEADLQMFESHILIQKRSINQCVGWMSRWQVLELKTLQPSAANEAWVKSFFRSEKM